MQSNVEDWCWRNLRNEDDRFSWWVSAAARGLFFPLLSIWLPGSLSLFFSPSLLACPSIHPVGQVTLLRQQPIWPGSRVSHLFISLSSLYIYRERCLLSNNSGRKLFSPANFSTLKQGGILFFGIRDFPWCSDESHLQGNCFLLSITKWEHRVWYPVAVSIWKRWTSWYILTDINHQIILPCNISITREGTLTHMIETVTNLKTSDGFRVVCVCAR